MLQSALTQMPIRFQHSTTMLNAKFSTAMLYFCCAWTFDGQALQARCASLCCQEAGMHLPTLIRLSLACSTLCSREPYCCRGGSRGKQHAQSTGLICVTQVRPWSQHETQEGSHKHKKVTSRCNLQPKVRLQ
jgi:hypothetical protein